MGLIDNPLELFPCGRWGSTKSKSLWKFLRVMRKMRLNFASLMRLDSERILRGWNLYSRGGLS